MDGTLVLGYEGWNDSMLHLCVRNGTSAVRIATGSFPSREIVMYEDYRQAILLNKLSEKHIEEIFNELWSNMDLIQPKVNICGGRKSKMIINRKNNRIK